MPSKSKILLISAISIFSVMILGSYSLASGVLSSPKTIIAFGADADQNKPQPIWNTILSFNPDIFLFLGDNVYVDSGDEKIMREQYAKLKNIPGYQKLLKRKITIMATWDDHDYGIDDGGNDFLAKEKSQKVFLDFFGEHEDSPRRKQEGIYDAKVFGPADKRVQIIALDTRYFRSPLTKALIGPGYAASHDPNATILGETQWRWFEEQLQQPAMVRIIMSSIQVITKDNLWENWMNFPLERTRLFDLIKKTKAEGIIFVSGDRHFGELTTINAGVAYPLYDLTTGSLNKALKKFPTEKNLYRSGKNIESNESFGFISIDWGFINPPQILLEIKDLTGKSTIQKKFPLAILKRGVLPIK